MASHEAHHQETEELSLIDCDVHQAWASEDEIAKYLPDHFQYRGVDLPSTHWPSPIGLNRNDATPEGGGYAGSDPDLLRNQLVDKYDIEYAVMTGSRIGTLGVTPNEDYVVALARAYNDWLIDAWLDDDDRFLGSLLVPPQSPDRAAEEIHRIGSHPQMVQVLMSSVSRSPYGQRRYWPIYEAAEKEGLPIALHIGVAGMGFSFPHTAAGYPSRYFERHTLTAASFMGQLCSMVTEGVFVEYPDLDLVLIEGGFSWLPYVRWRLDKNWKGLKDQTPWLDKPPSEYIRDHVRFTTQPIPEPDDPDHLLQMFDMIDAEQTVMFASDYPHWDADDPRYAFPKLPESLKERIFSENARELYGL